MAEVRRLGAQGFEQLDLHAGVGDVILAAKNVADSKSTSSMTEVNV